MFGHDGMLSSVHAHVHCLRNEQCTCTYDLNTLSHCWTAMDEKCQGPGSDNKLLVKS